MAPLERILATDCDQVEPMKRRRLQSPEKVSERRREENVDCLVWRAQPRPTGAPHCFATVLLCAHTKQLVSVRSGPSPSSPSAPAFSKSPHYKCTSFLSVVGIEPYILVKHWNLCPITDFKLLLAFLLPVPMIFP